MADRQLDEQRIFHVARKIDDGETREEYLEQICAGDRSLRERVEALLTAHAREQDALHASPEPAPTVDQSPISEGPGSQIGRYKLLQHIGAGGFGVVYMAEQLRPVRRKVALKIIKPGMDTRAVVARFEAERQALALMDHPNISRVLDGGATESGRPYFVMELVRGVPLTEYCDANNLPTQDRLHLFIAVCQAVQHAHQKGIIHRDLKPSNILVTLHDGQPVVKVIDFGVAKAINQQLTEKTLFTSYGQMIGTPQYMSPEQAEMSGLDVDTRSDVYSLGVLLYELLTGTTPLKGERLRTAGYAEMQRLIREEEPPKPSTRLSTSGEKLTVIAKQRGVSTDQLRRMIRGDLDWIVMRALEKDRTRRYETASSLAADVGHFLNDEPVAACPPSAAYRFRKFARRNKATIFTIAIVTMSLVMGLLGTSLQAIRARRSAAEAEAATEAERQAKEEYRLVLMELWEVLMDRAIDAAFRGDLKQTQAAIRKAELVYAPDEIVKPLEGLSLLFAGQQEQAVEELIHATAAKSTSFLAHAALWSAYMYSADFGDMYQAEKTIRDLKVSPQSDHERLFHYLMEAKVVPVDRLHEVIESLDGLIESHKGWGAAYAIRAVAWNDLGRELRSLDKLRKAIDDVDTARSILNDSPLILTIALSILVDGIEMARFEESSLDVQVWTAAGDEICTKLEQMPDPFTGGREVTVFCAVTGRSPRNALTEDDLIDGDKGGPIIATSKWLRERDATKLQELETRLRERPNDAESLTCLALILATESEDGRKEAMRIFEKLQRMDDKPANKVLALHIPLLLGRPDVARRASQQVLASDVLSRTWRDWKLVTEYHAGIVPEDDLLIRAAPFGLLQQIFYHEVAMKALAVGDRHKAKEYFQKVVETVQVGTWYYHSAGMFLERLKSDPNWPSWIERNDPH